MIMSKENELDKTKKKLSPEHKMKIAESLKGRKLSAEHVRKMSEVRKGKEFTAEHRANISKSHKGLQNTLGVKHTDEAKANMSKSKGGKIMLKYVDQRHYSKAHRWINEKMGKPSMCSKCKTTGAKRYEWSNISQKYEFDVSDWQRLCASCHRMYDIKFKLGLQEVANGQ